jgi:hypothetical protein
MMEQNVIALSETTKFIVDNRGKTAPTTTMAENHKPNHFCVF